MNITAYGRVEPDPFAMPRLHVRGGAVRERFPAPTPGPRPEPAVAAAPGRAAPDPAPDAADDSPPADAPAAPEPSSGAAPAPAVADTRAGDRPAPASAAPAPGAGSAAGTLRSAAPAPPERRGAVGSAASGAPVGPGGASGVTVVARTQPSLGATPAAARYAERAPPAPTPIAATARAAVADGARAPAATTAASRRIPVGLDPRLAALAEAARDVILRTVALETRADGGRIRMQLEPHDLGKLEIDIAVDDGHRARVLVIADRPEVAAMLERSLADLARTLAAQGLVVDEASVRHRQHGEARSDTSRRDLADASGGAHKSAESTAVIASRGSDRDGRLDVLA